MQIPDYKLKLSLEGGLLPPLEERGAGRCYFVLENLNSNPARTVYSGVRRWCVACMHRGMQMGEPPQQGCDRAGFFFLEGRNYRY